MRITQDDAIDTEKKWKGYTVLVIGKPGDWPCEQFASKCAEYSRALPYIKFIIADIAVATRHARTLQITHIPTTAVYRGGVLRAQVIGTNYPAIDNILQCTHVDGPVLAGERGSGGSTGGKMYVSAAQNVAVTRNASAAKAPVVARAFATPKRVP
jgi:hypothetical protein